MNRSGSGLPAARPLKHRPRSVPKVGRAESGDRPSLQNAGIIHVSDRPTFGTLRDDALLTAIHPPGEDHQQEMKLKTAHQIQHTSVLVKEVG